MSVPHPAQEHSDPAVWAGELGISREAVELYLASDVLDLHLDSFIWSRLFGYDLRERHGLGPLRGHFLSQVDFPRVREAGLSGATGRGITLTMITTMIGFGSMMLAEHRGIRSLGFVMLAGLGVTLLACYIVLPPLLRLRRTPAAEN